MNKSAAPSNQDNKKMPIRKIAAPAFAVVYIFLLVLSVLLIGQQVSLKFLTIDPPIVGTFIAFFTPSVLLACLAIFLDDGRAKVISTILTIVVFLPVLYMAGVYLAFDTNKHYYFSNDRRVDVAGLDQDGAGPCYLKLIVSRGNGPFLCKWQRAALDKYPEIGKEINGKVEIRYVTHGVQKRRDLDEWLNSQEISEAE